MENGSPLRDLIYFDFEKAASIFSQFERGLLQETQTGVESDHDKAQTHKIDLKIYKPEFEKTSSEKTSQLESRILHHDLLIRIEEKLDGLGVLVDLNNEFDNSNANAELIRSKLSGASYVRAKGWVSIEDYRQIYKIINKFNELADYIGKCSLINKKEYKEIVEQLKIAKVEANDGKNKSARIKARNLEDDLKKLEQIKEIIPLEKWFTDGPSLFIDTLMPERINFRVYPFESVPEFQVIANLKRECFVDGNLDNILFAYGIRPNVKLTIIGLITSIPSRDGTEFRPIVQASPEGNKPDLSEAFQNLFVSMQGIEKLVRFSKYPNITIYPLAVYHSISDKDEN
jgi:hypothetical protein